jgi:hypothetical protein
MTRRPSFFVLNIHEGAEEHYPFCVIGKQRQHRCTPVAARSKLAVVAGVLRDGSIS